MARTKKELARLASVAGSSSLFRVTPTSVDLYCPVDIEALRDAGQRDLPHRFTVEGLRWDALPKRADIIQALKRHLDPDWEDLACPHVRLAVAPS